MRHHATASAAVAALLAVSSQAFAAEGTRRCFDIYDDPQRLACYDSLFGKPVRPGAAQLPAPAVVTADPTPPAAAPRVAAPPPAKAPAPAPAPAQPVTGRITAVSRLANDRFAITLDNGQVWTQLERDLSAEVSAGDTVQIRPAMLGSWMLETRGGVKTRVRLAR
ncbi:MAG: hypothetical protein IPH71_13520 [Proteobacteria bacterium]|jgi:hypothetical protein|nr:hypothetical protein [Pseudomonadota bacterium]